MANMGRSDLEILQNNQADMVKSIKDIKQFVQYMKTNEKSKIQDSNTVPPPVRNLNENQSEFHKEQGNKFFKLNEYDQAVKCYTLAIDGNRFDSVYYSNRAICYLKLKQYERCIKDCTVAIGLNPYLNKAYYRRMLAHEAMARYADAFEDATKLLLLATDGDRVETKKYYNRQLKRLKDKDLVPVPNVKCKNVDNKADQLSIDFISRPMQSKFKEQENLKIVKIIEST